MSPELDKQLVEKYSKIFRDRYKSPRETCMCWGFEHSDGWYNLLDNACHLIQNHIDNCRKFRADSFRFNRALMRALHKGDEAGLLWYFKDTVSVDWAKKRTDDAIAKATFRDVPDKVEQLIADQVKEKFGSLNFYYHGGDDYCRGVISMMEAMSYSTCEKCSAPGKIRRGGWLKCLCDAHHNEREKDDV